MEKELVASNEYNEIEVAKYGKKKNKFNKNKGKNKFLIATSFILFSIILILLLIICFYIPINTLTSSKEFLSQKDNNLNQIMDDREKLNEIALKSKLKIYPLPQYFLHHTDTALLNIFKLVKLKIEDIDINRFLKALNRTIYNHPVLLSRFHEEDDGEIYIEYRPDLPPKINVITVKDEEIQNLKDKLLHIYKPYDSPLVNFTLFISNTSFYFFYDIFHSNFDGNSVAIFEKNLELAYLDKPLPKDYFFLNLYHYNEKLRTKKYDDTVKFYEEHFDLNREYCPKFDNDIPENIKNNDSLQLIYKEYSSKELRKQLYEFFGEKPKYYNIFMTMNILLADYIYSEFKDEYPTAKIGFNGRNWTEDSNSLGCLIYNFPVIYHFQNKIVNIISIYVIPH